MQCLLTEPRLGLIVLDGQYLSNTSNSLLETRSLGILNIETMVNLSTQLFMGLGIWHLNGEENTHTK